jgi:Ca-activated chloride channel homolog
MTWLFPAGIVAAVSLIAIVLLHMRHRLPEVIPFPQLAFWPRVPSESLESPRWRKPPLTLLFLLQLLAALLLVLAFMRPALPGLGAFGAQRTSAVHHVIVLDGSTSMLAASDEGGSRWDAALASVEDILGGWQQGDGVTLVVASARPVVKSAADARELDALRDWLERLAVPGGVPNEREISALLTDTRLPDLDRHITLVSDGGLELDGDGVPVTSITVGRGDASNIAIVSTTSSPLDDGDRLVEATVLNDQSGTETIPWVARTADQELASGTVTLAAGEQGAFSVRVPAGIGQVTLEVVAGDDMAADNRATVAIGGSALTGMRIVYVSDVPGATGRALQVLPGATVETYPSTTPGIADIAASADLVVYEASAPAEGDIPNAPLLLVQPTGLGEAWQITGVSPNPAITDIALGDPVMRDIPLEGVQFGETPIYLLQEDAEVLASGAEADEAVPLVWRGTLDGEPYVAYAFDPSASNIASRVSFPILVAQSVYALAGTDGDDTFAPGDLVTMTLPERASAVRIEDPAGIVRTLTPMVAPDGATTGSFTANARPGVWDVVVLGPEGNELERGTVMVNAGDPEESRLDAETPVTLSLADRAGNGAGSGAVAEDGELLTDAWPLLVIGAIVVLGLEWWAWLGRSMVRNRAAGGQAP